MLAAQSANRLPDGMASSSSAAPVRIAPSILAADFARLGEEVRAVADAGVELSGSVHLQSVVGEEDGGIGTLAATLRAGGADGAIVMEPTGLTVAPVQAGCVNFRIRVPGRAAHGAVRDEGISAFENAFRIYAAVQALEAERNRNAVRDPLYSAFSTPYPISIGTMSGGDWASSVPDHVSMEGRLGVRPDESLDEARSSDRKSTRLNSSHSSVSRMPSSA